MKKKLLISIMVLSICALQIPAFADGSIERYQNIGWTKASAINASDNLNSIIYANNLYIAVGDYGTIKVSKNKTDWSFIISGTNNNLYSIAWSGKQFVAVGSRGTILTSEDGLKWVVRSIDSPYNLKCAAWGSDHFVVSSDYDAIYTSEDGIQWQSDKTSIANNISAMAWGNGKYIAITKDGTILSSPDGVNWSLKIAKFLPNAKSIVYNGNLFVAVGFNKPYSIITSEDGDVWNIAYTGDVHMPNSSVWDGTRFTVVGEDGVLISPDGFQWKKVTTSPKFMKPYSIAWDGSEYCVSGENGLIAVSKDAITWEYKNSPQMGEYIRAAWNGKEIVVVQFGTDEILRSPDGEIWVDGHTGGTKFGFRDIIWDGTRFIAVGQCGKILLSSDGRSWQSADTNVEEYKDLHSIVYNGQQYVAVGDYGVILHSTDGISWSKALQQEDIHLWDVAFGNNRFVAVGQDGVIMTSDNGTNWTLRNRDGGYSLDTVVWNGKQFLTIGSRNTVLISSDGENWPSKSVGNTPAGSAVIWDGDRYVAVGGFGLVSTSLDGTSWTTTETITKNILSDIIRFGDKYLAVGGRGTIIVGKKLNYDTRISSKDYTVDLYKHIITKIPRDITVKDFLSKLILPEGATAEPMRLDYTKPALQDKVTAVKIVKLTAEDGTAAYYMIGVNKNNDAYLKPGKYMVNEKNMTISGVTQNTYYKDFIDNLVLPLGAKAQIYSSDSKRLITAGLVTNNMVLKIIAEDQTTSRTYKILAQPIKIKLRGKLLSNITPAIMNKTVYVPAEAFAKTLGARYSYDKSKAAMIISKTNISMLMKLSSNTVIVNKNTLNAAAPPVLINGIPYVPAEFVSEMLNYTYKFDEKAKIIEIR